MTFNIKVTKCTECPWYITGKDYMSVAALSGCEWSRTSPRCGGQIDPYTHPPILKNPAIIHPNCPRKDTPLKTLAAEGGRDE